MTDADQLSQAVVFYLGFGQASSPRRDSRRLLEQFGAETAPALERAVKGLIEEVSRVKIDWQVHSLVSAEELVRQELHERRPLLSEEALRALGWQFTFDWR